MQAMMDVLNDQMSSLATTQDLHNDTLTTIEQLIVDLR